MSGWCSGRNDRGSALAVLAEPGVLNNRAARSPAKSAGSRAHGRGVTGTGVHRLSASPCTSRFELQAPWPRAASPKRAEAARVVWVVSREARVPPRGNVVRRRPNGTSSFAWMSSTASAESLFAFMFDEGRSRSGRRRSEGSPSQRPRRGRQPRVSAPPCRSEHTSSAFTRAAADWIRQKQRATGGGDG